ncbi:MAG: hypothetical protein AAFR61_32265 [Bacteroidota bacterium]
MKKSLIFRFSGLLVAALFLTGCPPQYTTTTVNPDGSIDRVVGEVSLKSTKDLDRSELWVPADASWQLDTLTDSTAVLTRHYPNGASLNEAYLQADQDKQAPRQVAVERSFRWFYTVYTYDEMIPGFLTEIPLTQYLSEEEIALFKSDEKEEHPDLEQMEAEARKLRLASIEKRYDLWFSDHLTYWAIQELWREIEAFDGRQEMSFEDAYVHAKAFIKEKEKEDESFDLLESMDLDLLGSLTYQPLQWNAEKIKAFQAYLEKAGFEKKMEKQFETALFRDYQNHLMMPGQLISTNATIRGQDTLSWAVNGAKYMDSDFHMLAKSRLPNYWAFGVSILLGAMAISLFFKRREDDHLEE